MAAYRAIETRRYRHMNPRITVCVPDCRGYLRISIALSRRREKVYAKVLTRVKNPDSCNNHVCNDAD